ncbi:hypothetical protein GCM10017673_57130 [Streptosporangium violaceochromogenes]|nr:hypothetical protein GCM10017673_57130 [Streptosporangium violaceochromogenes]
MSGPDPEALWRFLAAGLACGTGLVTVYALGLLGLSATGRRRPLGLLAAGMCFLAVAAGVAAGLYVLAG